MQPAEIAAVSVGCMLLLAGVIVVLLQWSGRGEEPSSVVAVLIGAMLGLAGVMALGLGLRNFQKLLWSATAVGGLVTVTLSVVALIPPGKTVDKTAQVNPPRTNQPASNIGGGDESLSSSGLSDAPTQPTPPVRTPRSGKPEARNPFREVSPPGESESTNRSNANRARKRTPASGNRGAITLDQFRSRMPRSAGEVVKLATELDELWESLKPRERMHRAGELQAMIVAGASSASASWQRSFWDRYARELHLLSEFYRGRWTDLEFDNHLQIWHSDRLEGFSPESAKSLKVDAAANSHLMTADLFDGAKTIEAELEFAGDAGGAFGLFVVARDAYGDFGQTACWAAVSARGGFLRSGVPESGRETENGALLSLDDIGVDATSPFRMQLNVCRGYYQLLVNDRMILEKHDDRITVGKATGLALHPASTGGASCQVKDCRVRRWKSGQPIANSEFIEDELMYYDGAALEFPKVPDYPFRAAMANFAQRRFDSAARYARQAGELGLESVDGALFVAMDHEQNQRSQEALEAWRSTQTGTQAASRHHSTPREVARLYYIWYTTTHPDDSIRNATRGPFDRGHHPLAWVADRIGAAELASRGEFPEAARMLAGIVTDVPAEFRQATGVQLQAYRNGKDYIRPKDQLPFYHQLQVRLLPDNVYFQDGEN